MKKNQLLQTISGLLFAVLLVSSAGCRKTEFGTIADPAYIRVFNCLSTVVTLENKDAPQPFLTMLIDPVFDEAGIPQSAAVTGDFLETRADWARPYPDAANTSLFQKEYPGAAKVMAAPFLNGYDLSSWAQIASGEHRIVFLSRPLNTTPFFSLDKELRNRKLVDTSIQLTQGEVYTLHVLEQDYQTRSNTVYVRNETFVKQPLSDSLVYVNFYNLSSKGYFQYSPNTRSGNLPAYKMTDTMNVFYTLKKVTGDNISTAIPGFTQLPMGRVIRSQESKVAPYYHFPLIADTGSNRIYPGNAAQLFEFLRPGYVLGVSAFPSSDYLPTGYFLGLRVGPFGRIGGNEHSLAIMADIRSGLIVTERSGIYNPRYFATVNTVEFINDKFYITTIQRKFDPPVY